MSEKQSEQQQQQFRIPETIEQHKFDVLKWKVISTIVGLNMTDIQMKHIMLWVVVFITFIILKFIPDVAYGIAIGVCAGVCFLATLINRILTIYIKEQSQTNKSVNDIIYNLLISSIYGWLWSHQLYYSQNQSSLIVLSFISIATSIGTIVCIDDNKPIQEFLSSTLYVTQANVHSTLFVRLLLPLPLFILQLILDYGQFLSPQTNHLFYIRLSTSLVFLTWMMGWISTFYSVYYFFVNNINRFLFGDESKHNLSIAFISLVFNCVPIAIYYRFAQDEYLPVWILLIGSTLTSIICFGITNIVMTYFDSNHSDDNPNNLHNKVHLRTILSIILQVFICGALVAILLTCDFVQQQFTSSSSIKIITIINACLYAFFKLINFISLPRNSLGLAINFTTLNSQYMRAIERIVLRISSGLVIIIIVQNLSLSQLWIKLYQTVNFSIDLKYVQYFFFPFIVYRSFKRTLSQSTSFSLHLSILIALGFDHQGYQMQAILAVLFFPSFPQNFITTLIAPFTTPKKLCHRRQLPYQLVYLAITLFSWVVFVLSIGMLEFSMIFGLPVFWCVIPNINQGNRVKSKQHSLYQKIVTYIPTQLLRYNPQGFYLLRISKYILLVQIKSTNYGFAQTIDIKGLQVQQVTSCHSKQGDTIDKLVQETWGDNKQFFSTSHLWTVLSPQAKSVVNVPTQNQIQLTGIIQSKQFVQLFKKATLKALAYEVSKIAYTQKQLSQGQEIISDLMPICRQEKFQSIFPLQFAKQINFQVQYPAPNTQNIQVKKKLPPLKNKNAMVSDFMDLLETSQKFDPNIKAQTSTHYLNSQKKEQLNNQQQKQQGSEKILAPNKLDQNTHKINIKQLNASLIMTLYHFSVGKFDYLNIKKVYDLIKIQKGEMSQVKFEQSQNIVSRALCMGLKIAIDKVIMGQDDVTVGDFEDYAKDAYLGIVGSYDYNDAVARDLSDIWTLNYSKGKLSVKRLSKSQNELFLFRVDSTIIKSVWNNLRFELMYATNDNDERYSIQTHPYLMRNLWTEACQQPFGYPSYHSGMVMNF